MTNRTFAARLRAMSDDEFIQTLQEASIDNEVLALIDGAGQGDFEPSAEAWAIYRDYVESKEKR